MEWEYNPKNNQFYYKHNGKFFRIKSFGVLANGVGDLCFVMGNDNEPTIKKISEAKTEKLQILGYPNCDIGIVEFVDDIGPFDKKFLMFDINESVKPMVSFMLSHANVRHHGKDYEMFGGNNYQ